MTTVAILLLCSVAILLLSAFGAQFRDVKLFDLGIAFFVGSVLAAAI